MKNTLKDTAKQLAFIAACATLAALCGCTSPKKVRDIELKGMYVNGYSEVLAIGQGRLTSIPGEREALAAHYEEDTAWLSPSTKTHKLDIFLVGTNSVENSTEIIGSICKAFSEVAPQVAATHAANAGGTTALDVVKSGGVESGGVKSEGVEELTPTLPDSPTPEPEPQPSKAVTTSDAQASTNAVESVEAK